MSACFTQPQGWGRGSSAGTTHRAPRGRCRCRGDGMLSCGHEYKSGLAGQSMSAAELGMRGAFAVAAKCSTNAVPVSQGASRWEMWSPPASCTSLAALSLTHMVLSRDLLDLVGLSSKSNGSSRSSAERAALGYPLCVPPVLVQGAALMDAVLHPETSVVRILLCSLRCLRGACCQCQGE